MAIILIFEITLDYKVILPLMLACVVGYYTARSFPVPGIYSEELRRKGRWEFDSELRRMRVGDIMKTDSPTVHLDFAFDEICKRFILLPHNFLYVVDDGGGFQGAIALHDIKRFLLNPDLAGVIIARDITREKFPWLGPDDFLTTVFEGFSRHDDERLPVLDTDGSKRCSAPFPRRTRSWLSQNGPRSRSPRKRRSVEDSFLWRKSRNLSRICCP